MYRNVWTDNLDQLNASLLHNSNFFQNVKILLIPNFCTMVYMYILNKKMTVNEKS